MYNLFISHSWSYSEQYDGLLKLLDSVPDFEYKNYSVPKDDPIHSAHTKAQLRAAIKTRMAPASCVLILAGVYSTYSEWINEEIDLALNGFDKPKKIIAIEYWGSERTSAVVKCAANKTVKWQANSIVSAIRNLA